MKIQELKTKSDQELQILLKELCEKQRKLKFDLAEKKLKNPHEIGEAKKTIARILTIKRNNPQEK